MAPKQSALSAYLRKALLWGGLALCVFAVASFIWSVANRQTHTRLYRLRPAAGGPPTPAEVQLTAQVIAGRLDALRRDFRLGAPTARAVPPDRVEVRLACDRDATEPLAWATMQGAAGLHLLHPQEDILERTAPEDLPPDYEVKVYREKRYILTRLGELKTVEHRYAVGRTPALALHEFRSVSVETVGPQSRVILTFELSDEDVQALAMLTALEAGRDMGMLIDGELFFPPKRIESALTGGALQAQGFFHVKPLRRLAKVLDCGRLPWPLEEVQPAEG